MAIRFSVHPSARLVTYEVEGTATRDDAKEFLDAVLAHPNFERGFAFLGDRRGPGSEPDMTYVRAVAKEVQARASRLAPCRWAVALSTAAGFGAIRLCNLLTLESGVEMAPFMTPDQAAEWLGERPDGSRDTQPVR